MPDIDAAIARLTAYRATLDADAVVNNASGLTARDLDLLLEQLGARDYPATPAPWRPGMPATD